MLHYSIVWPSASPLRGCIFRIFSKYEEFLTGIWVVAGMEIVHDLPGVQYALTLRAMRISISSQNERFDLMIFSLDRIQEKHFIHAH